MSEKKTRLEQALDLFVYAPLGLALTAREELPRLVEKGRQQLTGADGDCPGDRASLPWPEGQKDLGRRPSRPPRP